MLNAEKIESLFEKLNDELKRRSVIGEVGICGGAVMCIVFKARESTKDIDGVFAPAAEIRAAVAAVAGEMGLQDDWLNDAAKGFFTSNFPRQDVLNFSNLRVWAPVPEYMLAMKAISARFDSYDKDDLTYLIRHLDLRTADEVFSVIMKYYPEERIPVQTRYFVEELLQKSQ